MKLFLAFYILIFLVPFAEKALAISEADFCRLEVESLLRGPSHQQLKDFAERLELVSAEETTTRFQGVNMDLFAGMVRNVDGILIPVAEAKNFKSRRDNLPEGFFGETGWEPRRESVILNLIPTSYSNFANHLNEFSKVIPSEILKVFETQTLQTSTAYHRKSTHWQVLIHSAPRDWGPTGGRTGFLLIDGLPVIIRDRVTKKEFLLELKGVGSVNGGYQEDRVTQTDFGGEKGGEWKIIGGLAEQGGKLEDSNANHFAFSILGKPDDAVLSLGYLRFDSPFGPQALGVRLSPGNVRATYVFKPGDVRPEVASRNAKQVSYLILKSILSGFVPKTHPENFIGYQETPQIYMNDHSDTSQFDHFPVERATVVRSADDATWVSLKSVIQLPGFEEKQNLKDIKEGLLQALEESKYATQHLRERISNAQSINEALNVLHTQVILKIQVQFEVHRGRLPLWVFNFFKNYKNPFAVSIDTIDKEIHRYALVFAQRTSELEDKTRELTFYPVSKSADRFEYSTHGLKEALLIPEISKLITEGKLSPREVYGPKLEEYFANSSHARGESDVVWSRLEPKLQRNKYVEDLKEALTMSPKEAATYVREYFANYSGVLPHMRSLALRELENEAKYLESVSAYSRLAQKSATLARKRIVKVKGMNTYTFAEAYLSDPKKFFKLLFLPYHQPKKLLESVHASDPALAEIFKWLRATFGKPDQN